MEHQLTALIAACAAFVGSHFAMSHPLRAPMVKALGPNGFQIVYSIVSAAAMVWIYLAFTAVETVTVPLWPGFDDASWGIGSALALIGSVLFAGSFAGNPALPMPGSEKAARAEPAGVFRVTRHPMMWGFSLIALGHLIAAPTARTLIVMGSIIVLALVGARLQDRKKEVLMGDAWREWESGTDYWPRWTKLPLVGAVPLLVGIALWLVISWSHLPLGGIAAGVWRWL